MSDSFNLTDYLESGVIEEYSLGLLDQHSIDELHLLAATHPQIAQKIDETIAALSQLSANLLAAKARPKAMAFLEQFLTTKPLDINNLPIIDKYADLQAWSNLTHRLVPDTIEGPLKTNVLFEDDARVLTLAWLSDEHLEDGHDPIEFEESIFILEGSCECNIGGKIFLLYAGDYCEIPPLTTHNIKNTSPDDLGYVKAIIQRIKAA